MLAFKSMFVTLTTLVALSSVVSAFGDLTKREDCGSKECPGQDCSAACANVNVGKSLEHYCYAGACYCGFAA
ncbi:hypothetical protein [Absidia glauca]|uniref:Uncharacterized protein n=1 Tax=Absidia glauca TaxID=4829 RepID=A0A168NN17_ABSGL|nr:hypothetical protein [Absidia glauca]